MTTPQISLRIDFGAEPAARIGPGKIALLEAIRDERSISAAARRLGMSYRRAWLLVDALNRLLAEPVAITETGGRRGGGSALTPFGERLVASYREIERAAATATRRERQKLARLVHRN
ncbi:MAG TPA: LysR family transcriptional regulator [Steroidobacteraceae bacterium]|nr:LysR family transcriptional regulator [Steroidobacteraceae bacterium]